MDRLKETKGHNLWIHMRAGRSAGRESERERERDIYIYVYMHACCEVIVWARFGPFRGYYLGQVGVIIWGKIILANFMVVSSDFCTSSYHFVSFAQLSFWTLLKHYKNRVLAFLCFVVQKEEKTKNDNWYFWFWFLSKNGCLVTINSFCFWFVFHSNKGHIRHISQCLSLFLPSLFSLPRFTLFLFFFSSLSLFVIFLPCFLSFFVSSLFFCFSFLPYVFAFVSWKEQAQMIWLGRVVSSILLYVLGVSCLFVFHIPFSYTCFFLILSCVFQHESFYLSIQATYKTPLLGEVGGCNKTFF